MASIFVHVPMSLMAWLLQVSMLTPMMCVLWRITGKVRYFLQLITFLYIQTFSLDIRGYWLNARPPLVTGTETIS